MIKKLAKIVKEEEPKFKEGGAYYKALYEEFLSARDDHGLQMRVYNVNQSVVEELIGEACLDDM